MKSRLRHKIKTGCVNVKRLSLFLVLAAMSCFADKTGLHAARPTLEEGFKSPPMDARPQTWWHWMDGTRGLSRLRAGQASAIKPNDGRDTMLTGAGMSAMSIQVPER